MSESIGQIIQRARTAKKLSLGQITRALHIREGYLEAIERDNLAELPSPVQAKGFIRLYWSYLGLDEQQLEEIWSPPVVLEPDVTMENPPPIPKDKPAKPAHPRMERNLKTQPLPEKTEQKPTSPDLDSDRIFHEMGRDLRDQRERLSLTVENIETYTHIPIHYLKAMEAGSMDELPSPVQARGMISNYASFLDLDLDDILLQYADGLQARREEAQQEQIQNQSNRKPFQIARLGMWRSLLSPDLLLVGLLILATLVALIWGGSNILSYQNNAQRTTTAIPISDILIHTVTVTIEPATPTVDSAGPTAENPEILLPTGSATFEVITGTPGTPGIYPVQVFVVALQRTYLRVIVDGKEEFNGRVIPGNPYSFNAQNQIELISGNAAALQIIHNQRNLGSLGVVGEVIDLVFGPDVYGTPTHTPTPTPTNTPVPSRTPRPSNTYPPTRTATDTRTPLPTSTPKPTNTPKGTLIP